MKKIGGLSIIIFEIEIENIVKELARRRKNSKNLKRSVNLKKISMIN
jgi:hypothetical protein